MIVYDETTKKLTDIFARNNAILVESNISTLVKRVSVIAETVDITHGAAAVDSSYIEIDKLAFIRDYGKVALQARYVEDIDVTSQIALNITFYEIDSSNNPVSVKVVSSAIVLTAKGQIESYFFKQDEMTFKYFKVTATESLGGAGDANIAVDLIY